MIYYLIIPSWLYTISSSKIFCFDDILVLELGQPIRIGISTLSLGKYVARKENLKYLTIDIWYRDKENMIWY